MDAIKYDTPNVLGYLQMLQSVVNRMTANSTGCKAWSVTIVTGVIAIVASKDNPRFIWVALVPTLLFAFLDSYYLALERCFRKNYNIFVEKLHEGEARSRDLFIISAHPSTNELLACVIEAVKSLSIWPFYGLMATLLIVVRALIG